MKSKYSVFGLLAIVALFALLVSVAMYIKPAYGLAVVAVLPFLCVTGATTLVDIVSRTGTDALVGLVEDASSTVAPEFSIIPARSRKGTSYKVTRRIGKPSAGFRNVNEALTISKSQFKQEVKEMYFLDCPLQVDEAAVKGDDGSAGDFLTGEAKAAFAAAVEAIGSQFYYGTTADAKGFAGLLSQSVGKMPTGGTTNSTSAYLVWLDEQGVRFEVGLDGVIAMPNWERVAVISGTTQKFAHVTNISGYLGLTVASASSVWRVSGITVAAPLTDARGEGLMAEVPLNRRNGLRWFMNRRAAFTLAKSRAIGGFVAAASGGSPTQEITSAWTAPKELAGVPITLTDSLLNTETNAGTADTYAEE